jgi:LPXTG-site transpeptidase (sortase) family protein
MGNVLIGVGLLLMLGVGAAYGYSYYMEQQARSDPWLAQVQAAWQSTPTSEPTIEPTATPTLEPTATPTLAPTTLSATQTPAPTATATPVPTRAPTATPKPAPTAAPKGYPNGIGMRIPALGIDSRIVDVGVVDGEFEVPRFYVGWYRHTAKPGEPGNGIYTGHVESLDKGQVFANLPYAKPGQDILLYTPEGIWRYRISELKKVPNDDVSVMEPTDDNRITLITCIGTYDWSQRQYTHRLVVSAMLVNTDGPERP